MNIQGHIITPTTITVLVDGATRIIDSSRPGFEEIPALLFKRKKARKADPEAFDKMIAERLPSAWGFVLDWGLPDEDSLAGLLDMRKFIVRQTHGKVEIADDEVRFEGKPIGGALVQRLIEMLRKGYDTEPLSLFLTNLMANPLQSARNELYLWLEGAKLPITDDGHFLAWKAVRQDYKSHHDGLTDNSIGAKPFKPREECDTERANTCSRGLHFCSHEYLPHFACSYSRIMIVKINPADVVSIPNDYNNTKGRAWTYEIIGEVPQDEVPDYFKVPVVSAHVGDIEQYDPRDWDSDDDEAMDDTDMGPDVADEAAFEAQVEATRDAPVDGADPFEFQAPKVGAGPAPTLWNEPDSPGAFDKIETNTDLLWAFDWRSTKPGYAFWSGEFTRMSMGYGLTDEAKEILRQWASPPDAVSPYGNGAADLPSSDMSLPQLELNKKTLRSLLRKYSQRRIAKDTGIPRTTLQEMIYRFWPEKAKRPTKKD